MKNKQIIDFLRKLPPVTFVGIMGVCGKSTVYSALEHIFTGFVTSTNNNFIGLNLEDESSFKDTLSKIKRDDIVYAVIKDDLLKELLDSSFFPTISVFTLIKEAKLYRELIKKLTYTNYIIGTDEAIDLIKGEVSFPVHAKMLRTTIGILPKGAKLSDLAYHIREDVALAVRVAEIFDIPTSKIIDNLSEFKGLEGRIEPVKKSKEISFVNDGYSEDFSSLKSALSSLAKYKNAVLIFGGMDKPGSEKVKLDGIAQYCHSIIVMPGSGTQKLYKEIFKRDDLNTDYATDINEAVSKAKDRAGKGDVVIFSPGFCSSKWCGSREERSKKFSEAVKVL